MTPELKEEHRGIVEFALLRVFPMIDEYTAAHKVSVMVESGVIVCLVRRLLSKGVQPEVILQLAKDSLLVPQNLDPVAAASPPGQAGQAGQPPQDTAGTNVINFKPRN